MNTTDKIETVQTMTTLNALIPIEDQEITEKPSDKPAATDTVLTAEKLKTLDTVIPEEEREVPTVLNEDYALAEEWGFFSPAYGMAQIKNALNDNLYASVYVDKDGERYIEFCQKYTDGKYSPKMQVAQSDLLFAASKNFLPTGITIPLMKNKLSKFLAKTTDEYLGKFSGDKPTDIIELLNTLLAVRQSLPVYKENDNYATPEQFYQMVMDGYNGRLAGAPMMHVDNHKAYYAFSDCEIEYLADQVNMAKAKFLKKLREYGFLYLTPSSRGYQTKVRFDKEQVDWSYCLYKMEYIASLNKKSE